MRNLQLSVGLRFRVWPSGHCLISDWHCIWASDLCALFIFGINSTVLADTLVASTRSAKAENTVNFVRFMFEVSY